MGILTNIKSSNKNIFSRLAIALLFPCLFFWIVSCGERENARSLRLDGLQEFLCKERAYDRNMNVCGNRSFWFEADLGFTAYVTIYGINSRQEALGLATFISEKKKQNKQKIPVDLRVYSSARVAGREPKEFLIYQAKI